MVKHVVMSLLVAVSTGAMGLGERMTRTEREAVTRYLLSRMLVVSSSQARDRLDREVGDHHGAGSIVYPQISHKQQFKPLQRLLDQAKENFDVIDFRDLQQKQDKALFNTKHNVSSSTSSLPGTSGSETVPVFLPFPGAETSQKSSKVKEDTSGSRAGRQRGPGGQFAMPLVSLGHKKYYIGLFFKANWFKAKQFCRYHGLHLASINAEEEQTLLEEHINNIGMGEEHFWTSGADQAEEGSFFWMSNGKPITYANWNSGEPNNFRYDNGEEEHCLELWDRDGDGLRWNDTPCSFETYFICEL